VQLFESAGRSSVAQGEKLIKRVFAAFAFDFDAFDKADAGTAF
jgi:hypothetical protein